MARRASRTGERHPLRRPGQADEPKRVELHEDLQRARDEREVRRRPAGGAPHPRPQVPAALSPRLPPRLIPLPSGCSAAAAVIFSHAHHMRGAAAFVNGAPSEQGALVVLARAGGCRHGSGVAGTQRRARPCEVDADGLPATSARANCGAIGRPFHGHASHTAYATPRALTDSESDEAPNDNRRTRRVQTARKPQSRERDIRMHAGTLVNGR